MIISNHHLEPRRMYDDSDFSIEMELVSKAGDVRGVKAETA